MGRCLGTPFRLLFRLLAWHLKGWRRAWRSASRQPRRGLRFFGLVIGLTITCILVPMAFDDLGLVRGISYAISVYLAISNATFFRVARVGRKRNVPLGLVAPIFILVGVIGSSAIRPLLWDAKDAALARDFVGAAIIIGVFGLMMLWFRTWQRGTPYLPVR